MENRIFYLSTCSTCTRILKELQPDNSIYLQDIKNESITKKQLEDMRSLTDSYESLFSRKAMKFRSMGLHEKELSEEDYKELILSEYTFLKRPVVIYNDEIFIGSSKATVDALKNAMT